jgi:hypothetical protein
MRALKAFIANNNTISDLTPLRTLTTGREAVLECLVLSHNRVAKVPPETFQHFAALKKVSLSPADLTDQTPNAPACQSA